MLQLLSKRRVLSLAALLIVSNIIISWVSLFYLSSSSLFPSKTILHNTVDHQRSLISIQYDVSHNPMFDIGHPYFKIALISCFTFIAMLTLCFFFLRMKSDTSIKDLVNSEEHYRSLFENDHVCMLVIDPSNLEIVDANPAACSFYGYDKKRLVSMRISEINSLPPDNIKKVLHKAQNAEENHFHFKHKLSDGTLRDVEVTSGTILIKGKELLYSIIYDITERILSEKKLKESEDKFKQLVYDMQVGVLLQGPQAEILLSNPKALELLGICEDQLLGKTSFDPDWNVIHEDGSPFPGHTHPVPQAIATCRSVRNVMMGVYRPATGDRVWLMVDAEPHLNDNGTVQHVVCSFIDITKRKRAEEALRVSEERLNLTLEVTHIGIWDWNLTNDTWYASPIFYTMLGYESVDGPSVRATWMERVNPEDRAAVYQKINSVLNCESSEYKYEARMRHADGSYRWHSVVGHVIEWDKKRKPSRLIGVRMDITEQKLYELLIKEKTEEIEAQNEEYRQMNDQLFSAKEHAEESDQLKGELLGKYNETQEIAEIGSWEWSMNNKEVWWSEGTYRIFETTPEEFKPDFEANSIFIIPEQLDMYYKNFQHCIETGESLNLDFTIQTLNGKIKQCNVQGKVLYNKNHKPERFMGTIMDITLRKEIENALKIKNEELIIAKEKAEENDHLKTAFLQNMSHEIRTPMNAIMGFSELLPEQYNNKPKLEQFSKIIHQRSADLLELINEILDIAKIESGQLPVHLDICDLNTLFVELSLFFNESKIRLDKQHIRFNINAHCSTELLVITDVAKLKQIFINLIGNAFKFTDHGSIQAGCKLNNENNLVFYVSDSGIGIPTDKQQYVFERFAQLKQDNRQTIGGTGLGLSIVKGLVNLLGGEIWIESVPHQGTTFYFTVPYSLADKKKQIPIIEESNQDYDFRDKTILIVEDDIFNAEYLKEVLKGNGLNILHTMCGREAVEIALSHAVDLVLMDINLPDINGYEATKLIKTAKPNLKIIAQTAFAAPEDEQKALEAGCNDYISKPLKKNVLLTMINKHMKNYKNYV